MVQTDTTTRTDAPGVMTGKPLMKVIGSRELPCMIRKATISARSSA
jgi:hypothetical protein